MLCLSNTREQEETDMLTRLFAYVLIGLIFRLHLTPLKNFRDLSIRLFFMLLCEISFSEL